MSGVKNPQLKFCAMIILDPERMREIVMQAIRDCHGNMRKVHKKLRINHQCMLNYRKVLGIPKEYPMQVREEWRNRYRLPPRKEES